MDLFALAAVDIAHQGWVFALGVYAECGSVVLVDAFDGKLNGAFLHFMLSNKY